MQLRLGGYPPDPQNTKEEEINEFYQYAVSVARTARNKVKQLTKLLFSF